MIDKIFSSHWTDILISQNSRILSPRLSTFLFHLFETLIYIMKQHMSGNCHGDEMKKQMTGI